MGLIDGDGYPAVDKGKITAAVGNSPVKIVTRPFMFNPNDLSDTKGITWGSIEVPGASHPVYQFGAGGERLISFELYLDGDRGRSDKRGRTVPGSAVAGTNAIVRSSVPLSVQDELYFYRSLVYPVSDSQNAQISDVFPASVFLTLGPLYKSMPVIVKRADWRINYWTPKMEPVRAVVSLQFAEIVQARITAGAIMGLGGIPEGVFFSGS